MKNLLIFLLGFIIIFALFLNSSFAAIHYCKTDSLCTATFTSGISDLITAATQAAHYPSVEDSTCGFSMIYEGTINYRYRYNVYQYVYGVSAGKCGSSSPCWYVVSSNVGKAVSPSRLSIVSSLAGSLSELQSSHPSGCLMDCPDSDSDGVCDSCDLAPNDSTLGKTGYVKGYYEYDGKIVAGLTSYSPSNTTYDAIEIYENDVNIPGYVLGLGMPTYIDEQEFLSGGGKFIALKEPSKVFDMECATVTSEDQCSNVPCNVVPAGTSASDKLPESGKGESEVADTSQKADDSGLMDLDKTCAELRTKCASVCGGATNVQNFACSENTHMVCECLTDGSWELAEDWDEVGTPIDESEEDTETPSTSGEGETNSGGGGTTSVSGGDSDGDGDVDGDDNFSGSYNYVEGKVDFDSVGGHLSQFSSKFPFSLRSTISSIYSDFKGTGAAPVYSYSVYGKTVTIDLAAWNDISQMIRSFFALGITISTIVLLIYLYVGIDLRGK